MDTFRAGDLIRYSTAFRNECLLTVKPAFNELRGNFAEPVSSPATASNLTWLCVSIAARKPIRAGSRNAEQLLDSGKLVTAGETATF